MNPIITLILSAFLTFSSPISFAAQGTVTGGISHEIPDWFKESFLEFADDAEEAADEDKHVMLFFNLNDCPYCSRMITENFADDALKPYLLEHFDSIALNIQGDREIAFTEELTTTEKNLANTLKIQYTPTIIFLNHENRPVLRLNGYRSSQTMRHALKFVSSKSYLKQSFSDYKATQKNQPKYQFLASELLSKVSDFSQISKPVALLIEDKNCNECSHFHQQMLTRPEIKEQLKKYIFVRLDAQSDDALIDFNGNQTTAKQWVEKLKISYRPGIVFFDEKQETARIESLLYPFHFEHVVRYGLNKSYKIFPNYLGLMAARQEKLLSQGVNINIGR